MTRYLVDTDVISAIAPTKVVSRPGLAQWMEVHSSALFLSAVTVAEIAAAIAKARREGATRKALRLSAWLRTRPVPGKRSIVAEIIRELPEIAQCDRVTGEDCFIALAHVGSVSELERVIDRIIPYAMTNTAIIQSSPVEPRSPLGGFKPR